MPDMVARAIIIAKVRHLQKLGVNDPNVDMFVGLYDRNVDAVRAALEAGADVSLRDTQVIAQHEDELRDFDARSAL
ncbi:MAG TPA: hypothetical protein VJ850_12475 [Candidatus Limnocylindrales bacterium]|nr:hypothetical protein [Candidatus Limnocylindrales bacterium]